MRNLGRLIVLCVTLHAASAASAVFQVGSDGKLLGAKNVLVAGVFYDVSFQDGSCISLFAPCIDARSFIRNDFTTARDVAQALISQVFVDGPLGAFDNNPGLIQGCGPTLRQQCYVLIPYRVRQVGGRFMVDAAGATNNTEPWDWDSDYVYDGPLEIPTDFITTFDPYTEVPGTIADERFTWATWKRSAQISDVPAPGTLYSLIVLLLALLVTRHRFAQGTVRTCLSR